MWWGCHIGIPYGLALDMPFGELLDLITVHHIQLDGWKPRAQDDGNFWAMMERT